MADGPETGRGGVKTLVEVLCRALVDEPDAVQVTEVDGEHGTVIEVRVAPGDVGKVIGRQGRVAKAIRTLAKAAAAKVQKRVVVEFLS